MARTRREQNPLDEALGVSRSEDRPASAPAPTPDAPAPETSAEDDGGGFLGLGNRDSFLRQALRAAVPMAVTGLAPGPGGQAFQQQFFGKQDELAQLAREQEQTRAATERENALLLWETFQNNPASFSAMDPETLHPIAEAASEQLNLPIEQIIQMMQDQAAQAAGPSTGQLMSLGGSLAKSQPEAAEQLFQKAGLGIDLNQGETSQDLEPNEVARIKENFTDASANEFFAAVDGGMSVAEAGQVLKFRPGGTDTSLREQMAGQAVAMMELGQKPDPLRQQAFNDYFNVEQSGLSPSTIAGVYTNIQGLAATLASLNPDDPKSEEMLKNSAGVAKRVLEDVEKFQKGLKRDLLPAEIEAYVNSRAQALLVTGEPAPPSAIDEAKELDANQAAIRKARAELGPDATLDEVVERSEEILDGDTP